MSATAVVTGATSGIGLAFAQEFARRGYRVVAVSRSGDAPRLAGRGHVTIAADLATERGARSVAALFTGDDPPEVLASCAGMVLPLAPTPAAELELLNLNVRSTAIVCGAASAALRPRGRGLIITVGSTAGLWSTGAYSASKAWVISYTRGLAAELAGSGVRALCVIPGFTRTNIFAGRTVDQSRWPWLDPEAVVVEALAAAEREQSSVIPSRRYRALVTLALALPPGARARLVSWVSKAAGL